MKCLCESGATHIALDHVYKTYGDKTVLEGFSYVFPGGETTCILGPSGCGKTTLLNMISGLESPDSGCITGIPKEPAVVFQEDRLCEDFSAVSNIRMVCGRRMTADRIREHLKELGLDQDADKPVRGFSGGMKRRTAVARAICYADAAGADTILMDEPFKGLDEELKQTVIDYVLKYSAGKTLIVITHDRNEAARLGGGLLEMNRVIFTSRLLHDEE